MAYLAVVILFFLLLSIIAAKEFYLYAMRSGRFVRSPLGNGSVRFESDFGTVKFDATKRAAELRPKRGPLSVVPFSAITGIKFRANAEAERINEYLQPFDWRDLLLPYHNAKLAFTINLVKYDTSEISIFWATQCEKRESLMVGISIEPLLAPLLKTRRPDDFPGYCRSVYERILTDTKAAGLALRIM